MTPGALSIPLADPIRDAPGDPRGRGRALDPHRLRWTPFRRSCAPSSTGSSRPGGRAILDRFIASSTAGLSEARPSSRSIPGACGAPELSRAKVRAIKDIARKAVAGVVPTRRAAARLSDDELVERLTAARGVGRWTVEMFLIFTLGREDVLPVDDFGVREGYRVAYGLRRQPKPKALLAFGERWRPHRTTAAWYLWRADRAKRPAAQRPSIEQRR
jgi:hypothetical protein